MSDPIESLTKSARQLIEIEQLLGGQFTPAEANSLPEVQLPKQPVRAAGGVAPEDKAAALDEMNENEVKVCTRCGLAGTRTQTVFGEGDPNAGLVFVGEGPGQNEDETGRPFCGRAGELLTKMIGAMGLSRSDVFICNVVKCRPPQNRNPMSDEVEACWPYLMRQLQIISPKVIVTMGNPATQKLLQTKRGITRLRGNWQELPELADSLGGIPVMPTFHPAYVLRNYSPQVRSDVWSDLKQVMTVLGLELPKDK
ncbi:MAG: uracil-DNA glycosylase [Phycisphaerae bacterium]|jgi:DNA polymerase|nr:uracil-DNA glycosylase [Phycisphaerae bacterium]